MRPVSQQSRGKNLWENFKSIVGALAIFLILRAFLVEAYRIPSGSMIPTLLVGDWLFVNKAIFGAHVPFTSTSLPAYREPRRGDVVVFVSPYQADEASRGADPTPTLVKRLVGTPGDTLYMRNGILYLNGIAQRQGYATAPIDPAVGGSVDPLFDWQKKVGLKSSRFGAAPAHCRVAYRIGTRGAVESRSPTQFISVCRRFALRGGFPSKRTRPR